MSSKAITPENFNQRTWTNLVFRCTSCGEDTRASKESIDEYKENFDTEGATDEAIVNSFEFCFKCVDGVDFVGEKVFDPRRLALKSYKEHKALSQETTAYSTKITLDGVVIGDARNSGEGGADLVVIDRESRALWRSIVEKWNGENGNSPEPEAAFIAHLAKVLDEKKTARHIFKQQPDCVCVVAVDDGKEEIGSMTIYSTTNFHTYPAIRANTPDEFDALVNASIDRQYPAKNPRRLYKRESV